MEAIRICNLHKSFGDMEVLKGVTINVAHKEMYALMGPNGSGKTTLTSIIACTNLPTSGKVEVLGHDIIEERDEVKKLIGYVPQGNFSSSRMTGRENLVYFTRLSGISKCDAKKIAEDLLEKMGLSRDKEKKVSKYSGGMRKKLEVATALLPGVKLLILDEPTAGLDPSARKNLLGTLKGITNDGITVFFVTHIGEDAEVASKVGFIDEGKMVIEDEPESLKKRSGLQNVINVETPIKDGIVANTLRNIINGGKLLEIEEGYKFYCKEPGKIVPEMIRELDKIGCKATRIETALPSLEDAFFKLTEKILRTC